MSYGDAFNAEGGGVYAMEWDEEALRIWHFPRSAIPIDITLAGAVPGSSTMSPGPDPESWGPPQAVFGGASCNPDTYFYDLSLVLNIVGPPSPCMVHSGVLEVRVTDGILLCVGNCRTSVANTPAGYGARRTSAVSVRRPARTGSPVTPAHSPKRE